MDRHDLVNSLEHGVYDVMSWVLFFPYTLVRTLIWPVRMMRLVLTEANADPQTAFGSAMRPALLLLIAMALGSAFVPLDQDAVAALRQSAPGSILAGSWLGLVLLRMVGFCVLPLAGAVLLDIFRPGRMTRDSLRVPFYQQCYICAPLALVATPLMAPFDPVARPAAGAVTMAVLIWFLVAEFLFFRRFLGARPRNAAALTLGVVACGFAGMAVVALPALVR
ncbi:MAG: hypothetical protein KF914_21630 [Rhizobiaceae bacterium]|nr:hypothetical protein [Rhizobiaceae bacterium]